PTVPGGVVNEPYSQTFEATGGIKPYSWSVSSGSLPPGLSLNATTGVLSGTPTTSSSFNFSVSVSDADSSSAQKEYSVSVTLPVNLLLGADNVASSGNHGANHLIMDRWTATESGSLSEVRVKCGASGNVKVALYADVSGSPGQLLAANHSGRAVVSGWNTLTLSEPVLVEAGTNYWLAFNSSASAVNLRHAPGSGARIRYKSFSYSNEFPATAGGGYISLSDYYSILQGWGSPPVLSIVTTALPAMARGDEYLETLTALGGSAPYSWALSSGALPTGISLNISTGALSGIPSVSGNFEISLTVTDAVAATASKTFSLEVAEPAQLSLATPTVPGGVVNEPYSQTFEATGGIKPYSWSVSSGSLPPGLSLNATTGVL
ncbi:MAG: putative Ig domain-containing protein, partial [Actinomycetota bacterium]|nr:putative Ig domain-containing protein [Actinomycetota bacterium]